jgi:hypothetical protein
MSEDTTAPDVQNQGGCTQKRVGGITGKGWVKGVSGHPGGRSKSTASIVSALRRRVDRAEADRLADTLLSMAAGGDIAALRLAIEHLDGKPTSKLDLSLVEAAVPKSNELPGDFYERLVGEVEVRVGQCFPGWSPPSPVTTVEVIYRDGKPLNGNAMPSPPPVEVKAPPPEPSGTATSLPGPPVAVLVEPVMADPPSDAAAIIQIVDKPIIPASRSSGVAQIERIRDILARKRDRSCDGY